MESYWCAKCPLTKMMIKSPKIFDVGGLDVFTSTHVLPSLFELCVNMIDYARNVPEEVKRRIDEKQHCDICARKAITRSVAQKSGNVLLWADCCVWCGNKFVDGASKEYTVVHKHVASTIWKGQMTIYAKSLAGDTLKVRVNWDENTDKLKKLVYWHWKHRDNMLENWSILWQGKRAHGRLSDYSIQEYSTLMAHCFTYGD